MHVQTESLNPTEAEAEVKPVVSCEVRELKAMGQWCFKKQAALVILVIISLALLLITPAQGICKYSILYYVCSCTLYILYWHIQYKLT